MPTQQTNFSVIFSPNSGIFDLTIVQHDGVKVFLNSSGTYDSSWQATNNVGSHNFPLNLPPGNYDIYLSVVTNVNCNFSVTGNLVTLKPIPTVMNTVADNIYQLTI